MNPSPTSLYRILHCSCSIPWQLNTKTQLQWCWFGNTFCHNCYFSYVSLKKNKKEVEEITVYSCTLNNDIWDTVLCPVFMKKMGKRRYLGVASCHFSVKRPRIKRDILFKKKKRKVIYMRIRLIWKSHLDEDVIYEVCLFLNDYHSHV